jgi:hypothetical protein
MSSIGCVLRRVVDGAIQHAESESGVNGANFYSRLLCLHYQFYFSAGTDPLCSQTGSKFELVPVDFPNEKYAM